MTRENLSEFRLASIRSTEINDYIEDIIFHYFQDSYSKKITGNLLDIIKKSCDFFNKNQGENFSKDSMDSFITEILTNFQDSTLNPIENSDLRHKHLFDPEIPVTTNKQREDIFKCVIDNMRALMCKVIRGDKTNLSDENYRIENQELYNHLNTQNNNLFDYLVGHSDILKKIKEEQEKEDKEVLGNKNCKKRKAEGGPPIQDNTDDAKTEAGNINPSISARMATPINDNSKSKKDSRRG